MGAAGAVNEADSADDATGAYERASVTSSCWADRPSTVCIIGSKELKKAVRPAMQLVVESALVLALRGGFGRRSGSVKPLAEVQHAWLLKPLMLLRRGGEALPSTSPEDDLARAGDGPRAAASRAELRSAPAPLSTVSASRRSSSAKRSSS